MTTGQITISFSFLKLSCCSLLSSVTLTAHFCALLIPRCDGISYHHTTAAQPRTEVFGEENRRDGKEEVRETKNSTLLISQTFPQYKWKLQWQHEEKARENSLANSDVTSTPTSEDRWRQRKKKLIDLQIKQNCLQGFCFSKSCNVRWQLKAAWTSWCNL